MVQTFTFEDYLKETWTTSPATDGLYKDQWEDAFDAWLGDLDGNEYVEFGNQYGAELTKRLSTQS